MRLFLENRFVLCRPDYSQPKKEYVHFCSLFTDGYYLIGSLFAVRPQSQQFLRYVARARSV